MSSVIDSYGDQDGFFFLSSSSLDGAGQSFTGNGNDLDIAIFKIAKTNSPTGNAVAKLYAHTGTFGSTGIPTGSALATSDNRDVTEFASTVLDEEFIFRTPFTTVNTTKYFIVVEYSGGDISNEVAVGDDSSSPTHNGNTATLDSGSWTADSGSDLGFSVDTTKIGSISDRFSMMGF